MTTQMQPAEGQAQTDPSIQVLVAILDSIGVKWILPITWALRNGPVRFTEIQNRIKCPTESTRQALIRMQDEGLITRARFREVPPRVEYDLTDKGKALIPVIERLFEWQRAQK